ncbi:MAG: hypothetical protein ACLRYY_13185 [Anaerobutyricum soehngenii]
MSWEDKDFLQILNSCYVYYTAVREETIKNQKVDSESTREESLQDLKKDKEDIEILVNMAKDYDSVLDFLDAMTLDAAKSKENAEDKLILSFYSNSSPTLGGRSLLAVKDKFSL